MAPVVVVGAGLAGLACALRLHAAGMPVSLVEAGDDVGGRVRTDHVDGFLVDRGFQVLLTAYPEAQDVLDYAALDLRSFYPGALVRHDGSFHRVADPFRRPLDLPQTLFGPIGTLDDKLRVALLRHRLRRLSRDALLAAAPKTTAQALADAGFSPRLIERFWRPFLAGVLLDRELGTAAALFAFTVAMFARGDAALPNAGMGAIPRQLAARLPAGALRLQAPVTAVNGNGVVLADGERSPARAVVVATDGLVASRLLPEIADPGSRGVSSLSFAAEVPPVDEPTLVLAGEELGPVSHLCVPSLVAPGYAPPGEALVSVSVLDRGGMDPDKLERAVRAQLAGWFGTRAWGWRHLRTDVIAHAQPAQTPDVLRSPARPVRLRPDVYVCGDHRDTATIDGALTSGRRAAEAVLRDAGG